MINDVSLPWSPEQWATIQDLIQQTARRVRVGASFLPLEGPLPPGQVYVPASQITVRDSFLPLAPGSIVHNAFLGSSGRAVSRTRIDDYETIPLATITSPVYLRESEIYDPNLAGARQQFSRAAAVLARLEDAIIFNGLNDEQDADFDGRPIEVSPRVWVIRGQTGSDYPGIFRNPEAANPGIVEIVDHDSPRSLVAAVSRAVMSLEEAGYYGPYACVLDHTLYRVAQGRSLSKHQPLERMDGFLNGGPVVWSSTIEDRRGAVIALGGAPVDLVVGSDLSAYFVHINEEPHYVFALAESIRLRIKDKTVVLPWRYLAHADPPPPQPAPEPEAAPLPEPDPRRRGVVVWIGDIWRNRRPEDV